MHIIIKNKTSVKGRSITEFADNLVSAGWPDEFNCAETKDRARFIERKERRPLTKADLSRIVQDMEKK